MRQDPVLFELLPTADGHQIAQVTLNDPKALNALSVEMCRLLADRLATWQDSKEVVAIVLRGSGEKAFCAGGNIRKLYESMIANPPLPNPYATDFFSTEYALYRQMHFYPKPIILWGNGIVMGGGLGLMAMCSHRIVTQSTRIAMPEISIGLYPDASGSWFLQKMPAKMGLFLGLTGANCNGADAILINLAEYAIASEQFDRVVEALKNADWHGKLADSVVSQTLSHLHQDQASELLPESHLAKYWQALSQLVNCGDIEEIDRRLRDPNLAEKYAEDAWFSRALASYHHGCPVSAYLTFEIFGRVNGLSLEQVLYLEMNVSLHCAHNPDFREGVRALLIDKDKTPQWSRTLAECDRSYILSHLTSPFAQGDHPFEDWLGKSALAVQKRLESM